MKLPKRRQPSDESGRRSPGTNNLERNRTPMATYYSGSSEKTTEAMRQSLLDTTKWLETAIPFLLLIILSFTLFKSMMVGSVRTSISRGNASLHSLSQYQKVVDEQSSGLTNSIKPLFGTSKLHDNLKRQFPEIENVSVIKQVFSSTLDVKLEFAEPRFKLLTANDQLIVDERGLAVARTVDYPKLASSLQLVEDQSGLVAKLGQQVLSQQDTAAVSIVLQGFSSRSIKVTKVVLPPLAKELRVYANGYYIKFLLDDSAEEQVGRYLAILPKFNNSIVEPAEYVDVRVDEKVFIK